MKVSIRLAVVIILIISAGIVGYSIIPKDDEAKVENKKNVDYEKLKDVIFEVRTAKVKRGNLVKTVTANGIVKANKELTIIANIDGFIKKINIYEGKHVAEGDLMVALDDKDIIMEVEEKEANLTKVKADYVVELKNEIISGKKNPKVKYIDEERSQLDEMFRAGKITKERYEVKKELLDFMEVLTGSEKVDVIKSRTGLNSAKLSLERAKLRLSYTKIKAPFGGVVGKFNLVEGQRIRIGEELFKLFDINKLRIEVGVLENEISTIEKGNSAKVILNAMPDKIYEGKVVFISPYIDPETKTCRVTIELENKDKKIKPGMFASVKIQSQVIKDQILIPKEALLVRDKRNLVFTAEGSLAKWKYVDIGDYNDEYYIVKKGVKEGEDVIVQGHYTLAHDANIKVIKQ